MAAISFFYLEKFSSLYHAQLLNFIALLIILTTQINFIVLCKNEATVIKVDSQQKIGFIVTQ